MLVLIEHAVWGPLDAAIEEEAETLAGIRNMARGEELRRAVDSVASEPEPGPGKLIRVTSADGETLAEAGDMPAEVAALAPPSVAITQHAPAGRGRAAYPVGWDAAGRRGGESTGGE